MNKIFFTKMSGAGNDFVFIDSKANSELNLTEKLIKDLCDRRMGIGADGVILIKESKDADFDMKYFNADGSTGFLCGNGARCSIKFAEITGRTKTKRTKFTSNGETFTGELISADVIKFYMNSPKNINTEIKINAAGRDLMCGYAETGAPHLVIDIDQGLNNPYNKDMTCTKLEDIPVQILGKEIRNHKEFMPAGTNVNFIKVLNNKIMIRTYERGVEDETFACGTGSVAASLLCYFNGLLKPPIKLVTKNGSELTVDFNEKDSRITNLSLTGPAEVIFVGEYWIRN